MGNNNEKFYLLMEKFVFQSLSIQPFDFDDRKVDLTTYFDETRENTSELEAYLKTLQNIGIAKSVMALPSRRYNKV